MEPTDDVWRSSSTLLEATAHPLKTAMKAQATAKKTQETPKTSSTIVDERFIPSTSPEGSRNVAGHVRRKANGPARADSPPLPGLPRTPMLSQARQHKQRPSGSRKIGDGGDSDSDSESAPDRHDHEGDPNVHQRPTPSKNKTPDLSPRTFEAEEKKRLRLRHNLEAIGKEWDRIRSLRDRNLDEGLSRKTDLLGRYQRMKLLRNSDATPTRTTNLSSGLGSAEQSPWAAKMESNIRQWDLALRRTVSPAHTSNFLQQPSLPFALRKIIEVVEENVRDLVPEVRFKIPDFERLLSAMNACKSWRNLKPGPELGYTVDPLELVAHVDRVDPVHCIRSSASGCSIDLPLGSKTSNLFDSTLRFLMFQYERRIAGGPTTDSGTTNRPRHWRSDVEYEVFDRWLRRPDSDHYFHFSQEYLEWILENVSLNHINRDCMVWEKASRERWGHVRGEFFVGIRRPGAVSFAIFKENSPIMNRKVSAKRMEEMGWFRSSQQDGELRYWRYEILHAIGHDGESAVEEDVIFRVAMDGEVLGVHLPDGEFCAWEEV